VVANGEWDSEWGKQELASFDVLVAADGGGDRILESGYIPHLLIGDLDSIQPENLVKCRNNETYIVKFPCEKDETDLELALDYAVARLGEESLDLVKNNKESLNEIWLLGATGGRMDHFLGNLGLMIGLFKKGYRIRLKDPYHELWLVKGKDYIRGEKGQELSLMPVTESVVVSTEGLKYPLNNDILRQEATRGISNVFLGEDAEIDVSEGIVLVVLLNPERQR
jgi:thiamine pyrophosphokinase